MNKVELDEELATIVLSSVFEQKIREKGGLAATFSKQILAAVPEGVSAGYAQGLSIAVDPESDIGRTLAAKGLL